MTMQFTELAQRAAQDGRVSADEVLSLRRQGWGDGIITRIEAEALFAVNNALDTREDEWTDFFVEAVVHFVLNGTEPKHQCDDNEARWLIAQVDHDGVVESMAELEAIVKIIERAHNVPVRLKDYVIAQVEKEVLSGTGPTRCGGELSSVHVTKAEADILRRVIFGSGGHGRAYVTRSEAEMLFRLKDETLAEDNAPEWDELFLDGVSNYLQGFAHQNAQLGHSRAKELHEAIADNEVNVGRFLGRMAREVPSSATHIRNHFGLIFGKRDSVARIDEGTGRRIQNQAKAGAEVTDSERDWLDTMIEADGEVDDLERRLIARIVEDGE